MSALVLPPTPRPARSQAPGPQRTGRGRAHLRVVTEDFVPHPRPDERVGTLPQEVRRRPGAPRPEYSPNHPAVRAARKREVMASRRRVVDRAPVVDGEVEPVVAATLFRRPVRVASAPSPLRAPASIRVSERVTEGSTSLRAPARTAEAPAAGVRPTVSGWSALPHLVRGIVMTAVFVVALAVAAGAGLVVSRMLATPTEITSTVVEEGQSLWQVAQASGSDDVAETVAQIVELNGLDSSTVHAGQTLLIPAG